ncbi:hypothetical protein [Methanofollis tationis]|uniref:Uncharacterized protein n=1 Tax=Methanofollis tationis TaxID=81417 RepID=A0A7K4HNE2_9EURY|nr:hypothetical protein [Methanofollis tationis]NVO66796.1 hypothetical protein [Methanofollis tationis]
MSPADYEGSGAFTCVTGDRSHSPGRRTGKYRDSEKLQPPVGETGWSHNLIIMSRRKDPPERSLIGRVEEFLRAMGGLFAFVGSQLPGELRGELPGPEEISRLLEGVG